MIIWKLETWHTIRITNHTIEENCNFSKFFHPLHNFYKVSDFFTGSILVFCVGLLLDELLDRYYRKGKNLFKFHITDDQTIDYRYLVSLVSLIGYFRLKLTITLADMNIYILLTIVNPCHNCFDRLSKFIMTIPL